MSKEVIPLNDSETSLAGSLAEEYDLLLMSALGCSSQLLTRKRKDVYCHTIEFELLEGTQLPEVITISSEPPTWPEQKQHQE